MSEYFVHVSSYVDDGVNIGTGAEIMHFCHIQEGAHIGKDCSIDHNVQIGKNVVIGQNCTVQSNVAVYEGIELEEGVYLGSGVVFTNDRIPRAKTSKRHAAYKKTVVKKGATVGANSTVVCGNNIGKYAMVAAGAVVIKEVPDHALMAGVPAKKIGWVCCCGEILPINMECKCGEKYQEKKGQLIRK